jgi:ABC-type transporter Mla subunit MlaD
VMLATALLLFGFGYYIYKTAERKGWFTPKFRYQTSLNSAAGLTVGAPVRLMGFTAGEITEIVPNEPDAYFGVTITFTVMKPHYGYIWDDSRVVISSDLLGNRFLEITKGVAGIPTIADNTNKAPMAMLRSKVARAARKKVLADVTAANPDMEQTNHSKFNWLVKDELLRVAQSDSNTFYTNLDEVYWISPDESPALQERLEKVVSQVEAALPNILSLTNQLAGTLSGATALTSNLNAVAVNAQPVVSNLALLTGQLNRPGALGEWLLPTNVNEKLDSVMDGADTAVESLNTNLATLNLSLLHLADLTSNLNNQVQVNTNMLSQISKTVTDSDDFVQGLKRHWLLRSAFKTKRTNAPPAKSAEPAVAPKGQGQ